MVSVLRLGRQDIENKEPYISNPRLFDGSDASQHSGPAQVPFTACCSCVPHPMSPTEKCPGQIFTWAPPSHHQPRFWTRPQQWPSGWGYEKPGPCPKMGLSCRVTCAPELSHGINLMSVSSWGHVLLSFDHSCLGFPHSPPPESCSQGSTWAHTSLLGSPT